MLLASALTGLLTLVLRSTPLMGPALIVHVGVLSGLYLTFPYSKFVHWVYRYVALVRSHVELPRLDEKTPHSATPESLVNVFLPADNLDS
jgi:citrate/tricarballylate utilization protein